MPNRLRCAGCGYYDTELEELENGPCEVYELRGHSFLEVDDRGMAIIPPEKLQSVEKAAMRRDSDRYETMRLVALSTTDRRKMINEILGDPETNMNPCAHVEPCPYPAKWSGLCGEHYWESQAEYWKREAERLSK